MIELALEAAEIAPLLPDAAIGLPILRFIDQGRRVRDDFAQRRYAMWLRLRGRVFTGEVAKSVDLPVGTSEEAGSADHSPLGRVLEATEVNGDLSLTGARTDLTVEGALFARYLLRDRDAAAEALERYALACDRLFDERVPVADVTVVRFARRRPWSLPLLDAAAGLVNPRALLRKKLLLMLAILETMPVYAGTFSSTSRPRWLVVARIAVWGVLGGLKAVVGLLLYPVARRAS
jgi:hypothetical protein